MSLDKLFARIRALGLVVHESGPYSYKVCCPISTPGNSFQVADDAPKHGNELDELDEFDDAPIEGLRSGAPEVFIWERNGHYCVEVWQYAPGPGPGDFKVVSRDLNLIIEKLASYFFNPSDPDFQSIQEKDC